MKADYIYDDHDYESFEDIEKRYYDSTEVISDVFSIENIGYQNENKAGGWDL